MFLHLSSYANDSGSCVPPVEVHAASRNDAVMQMVSVSLHINTPAPVAAAPSTQQSLPPPKKQGCLQCGLQKSGTNHQAGSKANYYEYCTVAVAGRFNEWIVPSGYEANDSQCAAGLKMFKQTWRRHVAKIDGVEEHPDFLD